MSITPRLLVFILLSAGTAAHAAPAAELFGDYCASCHGVDGHARTPAGRKIGAKDLTESKLPDADIVQQITNGKKNERGVEKMPAFKDKLSASDIAALVQYVKSLRK